MKKCPICHGEGKVYCTHCAGGCVTTMTGIPPHASFITTVCLMCKGTKRAPCVSCNGTGSIEAAPKLERKACTYCLGTGMIKCDKCSGTGYLSGDYGISSPCDKCYGQRKEPCYHCNGRGYE